MAAGEESRKVLCDCGKPLAVFKARGLELYCRFSGETTMVPYGLANIDEAIAFVERRRRQRRGPGGASRR
jgi:hypothetical protein